MRQAMQTDKTQLTHSVTRRLADYVARLEESNVSPAVFAKARVFFADGFACLAGGMTREPSRIAAGWISAQGNAGEASVLGFAHLRAGAADAAFVNGISAHYLDYDDVSYSSNAHVSAVLVPVVLAVGEAVRASGAKVLIAYVAGVETVGLLGRLLGDEAFKKGWHTTSVLGVFGAAAAAGKLLGLSAAQLTNALGLAASEASGIKGNFGSMAKAFHVGSAAYKGIRCAQLARLGMDANADIIEAKCGLAELLVSAPRYDAFEKAIAQGASEFLSPGLVMKPYPTCKAGHNGIAATLALVREHDLKPEEIEHVEVRVQAYAPDTLRYRVARTALEGRFSMNYCVALAILRRGLRLTDFEDGAPIGPDVVAMMERIDMVVDEALSGGMLFNPRGDTQVRITARGGHIYARRENYAPGDPDRPMTEAERAAKIDECLRIGLKPERVPEIAGFLERIDALADIRLLTDGFMRGLAGANG